MRNMTALAECARLGTAVLLVGAAGCDMLPWPPPPPPGFDTEAFKTVVRDVYGDPEGAPTIFMDIDGFGKPDLDSLRTILERDLRVKVRPLEERQFDDALPPFTPIDPVTGEPGVTIKLRRPMTNEENEQIRIVASFVRFAGSERGCTEYTLAREDDERPIIGRTDARPDCPIPEEVLESYEMALDRVQSDACCGLWANIGTCGDLLYVSECLGFGGIASYYHPETGLIQALEILPDDAGTPGGFVFGPVECEPSMTETILCDR